jgi:hypothetical protein
MSSSSEDRVGWNGRAWAETVPLASPPARVARVVTLPDVNPERSQDVDDLDELARKVDLLSSHREIEQQIYRMGYHLEGGDFGAVGEMLESATFGADRIGRRVFRGRDEIMEQYRRTNIVYPEGGRRTKEIYSNVVIDIDLDRGTAKSTTSFTVAQQIPGATFALLVAGRYEDEWERMDGHWRWSDRYIVAQYHNDLDRHMHSGSQPYN